MVLIFVVLSEANKNPSDHSGATRPPMPQAGFEPAPLLRQSTVRLYLWATGAKKLILAGLAYDRRLKSESSLVPATCLMLRFAWRLELATIAAPFNPWGASYVGSRFRIYPKSLVYRFTHAAVSVCIIKTRESSWEESEIERGGNNIEAFRVL